MTIENDRVHTLAKLISRIFHFSKKWKTFEMSCILACYDRQKTTSKVNQQPANHTESDEQLVSKEIVVSRRWESKHQNLASDELMRVKFPQ